MKTVISAIPMIITCSAALAQSVGGGFATPTDEAFRLAGGSVAFGIVRMSQASEFVAFGPGLEVNFAAQVGTIDDSPVYLEYVGFYGHANSQTSHTVIQGSAPLFFSSGSSPIGSIDLSTFSNGTGVTSDAAVQITDSTGDMASIISSAFSPNGPSTAVAQFAISQTDAGGIFTALTTNGETGFGSAYGVVFDDTGFFFLGIGDDSETAVTTAVEEEIAAYNHTVFLSTGISLSEQWLVSPRFGPTFRGLDRTTASLTTIDLNEGSDLAATLPDIFLAETTSLNTDYYGAIMGVDFTREIRENWLISLGAEVGLTHFSTRSNISNAVSIAGFDVAMPGSSMSGNGTAAIAKVSGSLTHISRNGTIISLRAFASYLSDAPYVAFEMTGSPDLTGGGTNIGWTGGGETYRSYSIGSKSMVSAGISLSAVFLF